MKTNDTKSWEKQENQNRNNNIDLINNFKTPLSGDNKY